MPKRRFLLKIYGPNGEQREIPRGTVVNVTYNDEEDGGYTGSDIETAVDENGLSTVANGDTVTIQVWHNGKKELRYFGKVKRRSLSSDDGVSLVISAQGEASEVGAVMLNRQFLEPGPPDIGTLWRVVADEAALQYPDLTVQTTTVGLFKSQYEAFSKRFGDASRDIIEAAGNRVGWGVRRSVDAPYSRILSLDRKAQPTDPYTTGRIIAVPSKSVSGSEGEADATDIRNVLHIRGGVPVNPNLVPNADFRLIGFTESLRNLLKNPGFDSGPALLPEYWVLGGGASKKKTGATEGPSHSGEYVVELDAGGESVQQTRAAGEVDQYLVPGHDYLLRVYARRELGAGNSALKVIFSWLDASNNVISSTNQTYTITDAVWNPYEQTITCPTGQNVKGFRVRFECVTASVLVDSSNFYDVSLVVPKFHELRLFGGATQVTANYLQTKTRHPFRSTYAPEFALRTQDTDGQDAQFGLVSKTDANAEANFQVSGNLTLRVMVDLISPRTPNGGYYKNGKFLIEVHYRKSDGGSTGNPDKRTIPAGSGFGVWNQFAFTMTAPNDAATATVYLTFRGGPTYTSGELAALGIDSSENGLSRIIIGAFCARASGSQPTELPARYVGAPAVLQYEWIPDGPFQTVVSCTDVMPAGSAEYRSIETHGRFPYPEENDSITTQDEAIYFAQAYFYAYAVERPNGSVTIEGDSRQFKACEGIRLRGKRGRSLTSQLVPLKRVTVSYDGNLKQSLTWGVDKDDPYDVFTSLLEKQKKTAGAGAGNGYYGSSGTTAGGSVSSGASAGGSLYWGQSPRTATDNTLHDDYYPIDGPHVTPGERSTWNSTAGMVADALYSDYLAVQYDSLTERLNAVEEAAAAGGGGAGTPGSVWYNGAGAPPAGTGINGDYYLNTTNYDIYQKTGGAWGSPIGNLKGATGAVGSQIYTGSGAPADTLGVNGDLYINIATSDYYQKSGGTWGAIVGNLKGATGAAGSQILTGIGAPSNGTGANGDFYLNSSNGDYYKKAGGVWGAVAGNLKGATGTAGSQIYTGTGVPADTLGVNGDFYLDGTSGNYYKKASGTWGTAAGNLKGPAGSGGGSGTAGAGMYYYLQNKQVTNVNVADSQRFIDLGAAAPARDDLQAWERKSVGSVMTDGPVLRCKIAGWYTHTCSIRVSGGQSLTSFLHVGLLDNTTGFATAANESPANASGAERSVSITYTAYYNVGDEIRPYVKFYKGDGSNLICDVRYSILSGVGASGSSGTDALRAAGSTVLDTDSVLIGNIGNSGSVSVSLPDATVAPWYNLPGTGTGGVSRRLVLINAGGVNSFYVSPKSGTNQTVLGTTGTNLPSGITVLRSNGSNWISEGQGGGTGSAASQGIDTNYSIVVSSLSGPTTVTLPTPGGASGTSFPNVTVKEGTVLRIIKSGTDTNVITVSSGNGIFYDQSTSKTFSAPGGYMSVQYFGTGQSGSRWYIVGTSG